MSKSLCVRPVFTNQSSLIVTVCQITIAIEQIEKFRRRINLRRRLSFMQPAWARKQAGKKQDSKKERTRNPDCYTSAPNLASYTFSAAGSLFTSPITNQSGSLAIRAMAMPAAIADSALVGLTLQGLEPKEMAEEMGIKINSVYQERYDLKKELLGFLEARGIILPDLSLEEILEIFFR